MGILESVGKGFSLSMKLLKVVLIFFLLNFIMGLIMLPFAGPDNAGNPQVMAITFLISIISVLIFIFVQGGALALVRDLLKNNAFSMSDFIVNGKKYYIKILGLFLIILAIALLAIVILALIASGVLAVANNTFTRSLVISIIVIVSLIAVALLLFPIYIIVAEDRGPVEALKKGIKLGKENFWRILGLFLILLLIAFGLAFVVGLLSAGISAALPVNLGQIIMVFINSILQSYLSIVMMIAFMAFYLGLGSKSSEAGPA